MDLAREDCNDLYPATPLIAYTGLRRGEAMSLFRGNADLDEGFLRIEHSLVFARTGMLLEPPKTESGPRTVDIDDGTGRALHDHRRRQGETRERMGNLYVDEDRAFADDFGKWISPKRLYHT